MISTNVLMHGDLFINWITGLNEEINVHKKHVLFIVDNDYSIY